MLRSMFSAIGGLKSHQTMMDVTANNIANVNTIGYKAQRVTFAAMLSQNVRGASAPVAGGQGGVNPTQVGHGVGVSGTQTMLTQGSGQSTGQWSDLRIDGDGFFMVAAARPTSTPTDVAFTRAGNFTLDKNGDLVTADGQYVLGNPAIPGTPPTFDDANLGPITIPNDAQGVSIGNDGSVSYVDSTGAQQVAGRVALAKFPNPGGLARIGDNLYQATANSGTYDSTTNNNTSPPTTGVASWGGAGLNGRGAIVAGQVEMSNVDLSQEFTSMITAQRGFQANSKVISASDEMLQDLVNMKR
jgi:flagellar hook protein FlgE